MNIKKVEKQVRKISQLLENIKEEGHVNKIERDLMMSYIRDLYEKVSDFDTGASSKSSKKSSNHSTPVINTPIVETPAAPVEMADVVRREVADRSVPQAQPAERREDPYQSPPYVARETPAAATAPAETPAVVATPVVETPAAPEELLELFSMGAISEISDKLSRSPIADLTRCMGINEKIFTVQELFGGDKNLFDKSMSDLNGLSSLEQARDYLVTHIAIDQDWASAGKIKKAANFVKLISRRY